MRRVKFVLGVLALGLVAVVVVLVGPRMVSMLLRPTVRPARGAELVIPTPEDASGFALSSPDVEHGGELPRTYTCDGSSSTLPLSWHGAPPDTQSFALIMHHVDGQGETHWYWILYDLPPTVDHLPTNVSGIGTLGTNSVNRRNAYAPPCSKGPGPKLYTYTVYALKSPPSLTVPPATVTRDVMLTAMQGRILGVSTLKVVYTRWIVSRHAPPSR